VRPPTLSDLRTAQAEVEAASEMLAEATLRRDSMLLTLHLDAGHSLRRLGGVLGRSHSNVRHRIERGARLATP